LKITTSEQVRSAETQDVRGVWYIPAACKLENPLL
jgi:hypothetical protein